MDECSVWIRIKQPPRCLDQFGVGVEVVNMPVPASRGDGYSVNALVLLGALTVWNPRAARLFHGKFHWDPKNAQMLPFTADEVAEVKEEISAAA